MLGGYIFNDIGSLGSKEFNNNVKFNVLIIVVAVGWRFLVLFKGAKLLVSFLGAILLRRDTTKSGALYSSYTTYDDAVVDLTQVLLPLLYNKSLCGLND